jgi:hypothetical protein
MLNYLRMITLALAFVGAAGFILFTIIFVIHELAADEPYCLCLSVMYNTARLVVVCNVLFVALTVMEIYHGKD